jgi:hypothetical protein
MNVSMVSNETDLRCMKHERIWSCEGYHLALADFPYQLAHYF